MAAAARELTEETGYSADRLQPLGRFFTSPGFTDEHMHVFVAEQLSPGSQQLEPGERIEVHETTMREALAMIDDNRIEDGKTIAALLMWDRQRRLAGSRDT
jgi:ADP-ribose pyrophosphatase